MSRFDLIIFDCDGTLVDSEELHNTASSQILTELGFPQYTPEYCLAHFVGSGQQHVWQTVEREQGVRLPAHANRLYIERVAQLQKHLARLAPGIVDILAAFSRTHQICVGSNGEPENVHGILRDMDLMRFFAHERVFTAHQVAKPKPAPDLFLYAARECGAAPERVLVVEDSITGAAAGVAAGMTVFGYYGLAHDGEERAVKMREIGVHAISDDLTELLSLVNS